MAMKTACIVMLSLTEAILAGSGTIVWFGSRNLFEHLFAIGLWCFAVACAGGILMIKELVD